MHFFHCLSKRTSLKVCRELGKGQARPEFVVCIAFRVTCSSLPRPAFPVFLLFACCCLNCITAWKAVLCSSAVPVLCCTAFPKPVLNR